MAIYQVKFLILSGSLAFQIVLAEGHESPCKHRLYIKETENLPEASKAQETMSGSPISTYVPVL
jgi:hypothetical protein